MEPTDQIPYESFKEEWLKDILEGNPSTVDKGNRFARKLLIQWLNFDDNETDVIFCDGCGDGGIDAVYLDRMDDSEDNANSGNRWYLVQSKYGSAFYGTDTLLIEGQKVIETLDGKRLKLSSLASEIVERLQNFNKNASSSDKLQLVFATVDPLTEAEERALKDIRSMGRERLGDFFETGAVSVQTIYKRVLENVEKNNKLKLSFSADLVQSGSDLLVGSVKLINLYGFLKAYTLKTGDIDLIYSKNVRRFLGAGRKVNQGIATTLNTNPENFGLYNNGITIVVEKFECLASDKYELVDPYIVNGCQTTRSIWDVLNKKLDTGATGTNPELENWKECLSRGIVVVKIVKVGTHGEKVLTDTTRFTNSQNAVGQKDFISLEADFRRWAEQMSAKYNVYLEIQRGGWDSQRYLQKHSPNTKQFAEYANAFDLLKVYGSGWLCEPGLAYGKNPPFAPGGSIFKRIVESQQFTVDDLYATFLLYKLAAQIGFGRGASKATRGQTKHLFYFVFNELLKECLLQAKLPITTDSLTASILKVFAPGKEEAKTSLCETALNVVDDYLTQEKEDSLFKEPEFKGDMNAFLKSEKLGKSRDFSPKLDYLINIQKSVMRKSYQGSPAIREIVIQALS